MHRPAAEDPGPTSAPLAAGAIIAGALLMGASFWLGGLVGLAATGAVVGAAAGAALDLRQHGGSTLGASLGAVVGALAGAALVPTVLASAGLAVLGPLAAYGTAFTLPLVGAVIGAAGGGVAGRVAHVA